MIIQKLVRNFTPGGCKPVGVCIHIMEGNMRGTRSWFNNPVSRASSHYGVSRTGEVWQFVKEEDVAWAQGGVRQPTARLVLDRPGINPNRYLISIEHEGFSNDVWSEPMKKASAELIRNICIRHIIPINRTHIIGHYEINSVSRPNCPAINKIIIDDIVQIAQARSLFWIKEQIKIIKQKIINLLQILMAKRQISDADKIKNIEHKIAVISNELDKIKKEADDNMF